MTAALPEFLCSSPAGLHIRDFNAFAQSDLVAPISDNQDRSEWASEAASALASQIFCPGPEGANPLGVLGKNLFIYNKSRDTDRICPACLRWYRVGEGFKSYSNLDEFMTRPILAPPEVEQQVAAEQELSGICTRHCMKVMNEGSDALLGKNADMLSAKEVANMNSDEVEGLIVRKATDEEQAQGFKLVFTPYQYKSGLD